MKTFRWLAYLFFSVLCGTPAAAQGSMDVKMGNYDAFRNSREKYTYLAFYKVSGHDVYGNPYYNHDFAPGKITTADGRVFEGYQLRYDLYNQTVFFQNGKDALEISDPIREFTIRQPEGTATFVAASQFEKSKKPLYYEVLLKNEKGQLLRKNVLKVEQGRPGIQSSESTEQFVYHPEYYYFNNGTRKLSRIQANGANIPAILGTDAQAFDATEYNFTDELSLLKFFQSYFASH